MRCIGIDFTSAPRPSKPITVVFAEYEHGHLQVNALHTWASFAAFQDWLQAEKSAWICAIDAPLSFPATFWAFFHWPTTDWQACAQHLANLTMPEFEAMVTAYSAAHPPGAKLPMRWTDRLTKSSSPVRLYRVPVGRMAFRLWPLLLQAAVHLHPVRPTRDSRVMLEGYPALVARAFIGKTPYKSDDRGKQSQAHRDARFALLKALQGEDCLAVYGFNVALSDEMAEQLLNDAQGDCLDALHCCVQAAWASTQQNYGVPDKVETQEGWIVDPQSGRLSEQTLQ